MKGYSKSRREVAPVVVDLFCGAGGLSYGLQSAGLTILKGVDLDPSCKYPLEANTSANFICADVAHVSADHVSCWFGDSKLRVLAGCAPCQPFSSYSQSRKSDDERWKLLQSFQRLAVATKPEIVTMENVVGLARQEIWFDFIRALEDAGYWVSWQAVDCKKFGVPQTRKRLVLIGSRFGLVPLRYPEGASIATVRQTIGMLPSLEAGQGDCKDRLHIAAGLRPVNLDRIRHSRPGGTWRDWPIPLRANCHSRQSGSTYPSVYGRMEWDKPAPTITTQCYGYGNGRFGHPVQDRAISLREAAMLQSFPNTYKFIEEGAAVSFANLGTLIGNAVPPKLGQAIGECIIEHLAMHTENVRL